MRAILANRLGVEALLDGSIRKAGKRVRINVQLIDAKNGYQLWSERFDREIEDIFAIQDEIARSVLESLGLALTEREEFRFLKPPRRTSKHTNFIFADVSFITNGLVKAWSSRGRCSSGRSRSIPTFAAAWAGLANAYVDLFRWGRKPARFGRGATRKRAMRLKLNPNSAEAHVSVGQALAIQRRFLEAAICV